LSRQVFHLIRVAGYAYLRKGKERGRNEYSMKERRKGKRDKEMTEGMTEEKTNNMKRNAGRGKEIYKP
jgi:hypothetical protein